MDSQEAKRILLLHRPGSPHENDPEMLAALHQVNEDPELERWFEHHRAFQAAARQKLRQIQPPDGLRERILRSAPVPTNIVWWRKGIFLGPALAAAASIVLLFSLLSLRFGQPTETDFDTYRNKMVSRVLREYTMDLVTTNATEIREFISRNNGLAEFSLTPPLQDTQRKGCGLLSWRGRPVTMVCFEAGRRELFLFVTNRSDLSGTPPEERPQFAQVKKLMTASWTQGDKTYILAARADEQFLKGFL